MSPIRESIWPIYIFDLNCTGEENTIWECPFNGVTTHNCHSYYDDASLKCEGEHLDSYLNYLFVENHLKIIFKEVAFVNFEVVFNTHGYKI